MKINVGRLLFRRAMLSPDRTGLVCEGREYTYSELNQRSNRLAHAMEKLGIRSGDRVGMLGLNGVEYFDLLFGLAKTGAILVPVNYRLAAPELASILTDAGIRVLVHNPAFQGMVDVIKEKDETPAFKGVCTGAPYDEMIAAAKTSEPIPQAGDDDELAIIYTVWSTGRPKGVTLSHENFFWSSVTAISTLSKLGDTFLLALPFYHIGALAWLPIFMHLGLKCVLMPRFGADRFLELIETEQVTSFGAVPTMLYFLKDSPGFSKCDFTKVQTLLGYGSAVPIDLIEEYAKVEVKVLQLYGLTESAGPALVIDSDHALAKAGSVGQPFFHTRVRLVNDMGIDVGGGAVGEIIIQAGHVMKGYWNQPEATQDALRDGWLYTGDLGRQDGDGYFYVVDRKKDMIISGGENIFPGEIERVIIRHPDVVDVAVIAHNDKVWGELVKAIVEKKPGQEPSERDIVEWCRGKIADYKLPKVIEFVDSLPRTMTGKMEKRKLR